MLKYKLRDMSSEDLNQVLIIERGAQLSPWSRLSFEESLTQSNYCRVLESEAEILAYHITSSIADELHLLNLVVANNFQGKGHAHELMQDIFNYAQAQASSKILLEVRASNSVANCLYRSWGFEQLSIRKKYYQASGVDGEREDAVIMIRLLK